MSSPSPSPSLSHSLSSDSAYVSSGSPSPSHLHPVDSGASRWRAWTAADRAIAAALDALRDRDLAVHLYNAHVLKRRAKLQKQRTGDSEEDVKEKTGKRAFMPPKGWTAWPMREAEVPRE